MDTDHEEHAQAPGSDARSPADGDDEEIQMDVKKGRGSVWIVGGSHNERKSPQAVAGPASGAVDPDKGKARPRKQVVLPSQQLGAAPLPFATHAPAPPADDSSQSQAAEAPSPQSQKQYSTGLILGILMIVIALGAGISIVRLYKDVRRLEHRIQALENARSSLPWYSSR